MLKAFLPPWLLATLTAISVATVAVVESGLIAEGTLAYTIVAVVAAILSAVVGGKGILQKRQDPPLYVDHRSRDIRTKTPEPPR